MVGQKFGRLTVIERAEGKDKRRIYWLCQCECGNMKTTLGQQLRSGMCKSCGCLGKDKNRERIVDLTGRVVGKLTVIELAESKNGKLYWLCQCECGNSKVIIGAHLSGNRVKSCGCAKIIHSDLTGMRFGRLTVLESPREVDYRKRRVWKCICDCGNEISAVTDTLVSKKTKSCGCIKKEADVEKMRKIVKKNNVFGTSLRVIRDKKVRSDSTTGVTGVSKGDRGYIAHIGFQGKYYHLGVFDTIGEATVARKKAEVRTHDAFLEWYTENHPDMQDDEDEEVQIVAQKNRKSIQE